nr:hypothetical protein [uncultured Pseudomonas sp.]
MKTLFNNRHLIHTLALLAAIGAGQLQASQDLRLAENGSERVQQQAREQHAVATPEVAENGSERSFEHQRQLHSKQALQVVEGGAERSQAERHA